MIPQFTKTQTWLNEVELKTDPATILYRFAEFGDFIV